MKMELEKCRAKTVEHGVLSRMEAVVTLPVLVDGKDSGACLYVCATSLSALMFEGKDWDALLKQVAARLAVKP